MVITLSKSLDLWFWLQKLMECVWLWYLVVDSTRVVTVNFTRLNPQSIGDKATSLWFESYPNIGEKVGFALEKDSASLQILEKEQSSG